MSKVFIAVPTYESITPDTYKGIYGLDKGGNWVVFDFKRGYDCARARNDIAQQTLDEQADYVLMVDNDVVLPSDALVNLLSHDLDVVLGYYARRGFGGGFDGRTSVYKNNGEHDYVTTYDASELRELRESGEHLLRVHGGGMGCALIRASVFERLCYPWYKFVTYDNGSQLSEDLYFCEQLNKVGIPIHVDVRVACGHVFRYVQGVV